jgi:hypothetical protein
VCLCSNKGVVKKRGIDAGLPNDADGLVPVEAMYNYTASAEIPFLPDTRR